MHTSMNATMDFTFHGIRQHAETANNGNKPKHDEKRSE